MIITIIIIIIITTIIIMTMTMLAYFGTQVGLVMPVMLLELSQTNSGSASKKTSLYIESIVT